MEDTPLVLAGGSVTDVDASASDILLLSLHVDHGTLAANGTAAGLTPVVGEDGSNGTLSFTGTLADINAAIADGAIYTPATNYSGTDTMTVTVNDQGHTGADPGLTGDATSEAGQFTVPIIVNPINDVPAVSTLDVSDTNIRFSISDVDSSSFTLAAPFAVALGNPSLALGDNDIAPVAQASAVSGTLQVSDGAGGTASVIGLYLGTDGDDASATAPLAGGGNAIYGFGGNDTLTGSGAGNDTLTGGTGSDTFVFTNFTHSLAANFDTVTDFVTGVDSFAIGHALTALTTVLAPNGTGDLASDLAAVLDSAHLVADGAAEVTITGGSDAGTYAVISDTVAGFNPATDAVVKLTNAAVLHAGDFHV
jgi:hypothetical protein